MNAKDTIMIARAARQFLWAMLLLSLDTLPAEGHSPAKQISPHDCSEKVSNDTDVSVPDSCDYRWSERTTFVQCCEIIQTRSAGSGNKTKSKPVDGMECCAENLCPGQTNFTFNEVLPCIPWHVPGIGNASAPKNVSVTAFCCQTHCCHLRKEEKEETARLPKLVEELDSVKEINHQWLVILSITVAMCGFVAIAFSIYMCHAHQLCQIPSVREYFFRARRRKSSSSLAIGLNTPPMKLVTRNVNNYDVSPGESLAPGGLRTADMYGETEDELDKQWLMNSVVDGTATSDRSPPSYPGASVVYQHRVQPSRR